MTKIRQDSKAAYEKYAGQIFTTLGKTGVICGFDNREDENIDLIMALLPQQDMVNFMGWRSIISSDILFSHKNNPQGYYYININVIEELLQEKED
ncbi:MAG: hypothetical protein WC827_03590 [Candidatus Paceibacterota bacterium]|jgi:hypothetical protein